jgi:DNA polymerase I-like protein with 3'-5' exonuclease and polymerase domains
MSTDTMLVVLPEAPPAVEQPKPKTKRVKLTPEERAERDAAKKVAREAAKMERARLKAIAREQARLDKIADAEGGKLDLPAVVLRDGTVFTVRPEDIPDLLLPYMGALCLDVEHSGYDFGHKSYELRTVQLGGEDLAVVLDGADGLQMDHAKMALQLARKLHAHSASADIIPCVMAGLIGWDEAWAKMHDSVLYAKLTDPKMSDSDASKLKELARDMLGDYATAPEAEKAKNALFRALGCLTEVDALTPPERNGWFMVDKRARTMIAYAGSDVLDLGAVMKKLEPMLPVSLDVLERERSFEAVCARVAWKGFPLDHEHIKVKIAEAEKNRAEALEHVHILSGGLIENPSSPDTGAKLIQLDPSLDAVLERSEKTGEPSAAKPSLEKVRKGDTGLSPLTYPLTKAILAYRSEVTKLGLLLRPLNILCEEGDGRMRPTVLTINADTGRCSCVRPNGQQFSRQGGIRQCVCADCGYVMVNADLQGCEICVAAGLSGDKGLLEAELSPRCYRCEFVECTCGGEHSGLHWMAAHEAFGKGASKEHRYWCKRVIFSKLFGGSAAAGARQVGIDISDSQRIHDAFEALAPVYAQWDKWLRNCFYEGAAVYRDFNTGINYSEPLNGGRRGIYRTYNGRNIYINAPHAFGNYAIQGTARELLVEGVLRWDGEVRKHPEWETAPVLPIHDEALTWVKREYFREATETLRRCMETDVLSTPDWNVHVGADPELQEYSYWPDSS